MAEPSRKTFTVQVRFPSGLTVTLPDGTPVPQPGDTYEHRTREAPRQEGTRWRTRTRVRRGVVARVRWSTECDGTSEHTFAVAELHALPRGER